MTKREKITEVNGIESSVYEVFYRIDRMMAEGKFSDVDEVLRGINVDELAPNLLLAYLTITAVARDKLQERADFFNKVRERLLKEKAGEVDLILQGLG